MIPGIRALLAPLISMPKVCWLSCGVSDIVLPSHQRNQLEEGDNGLRPEHDHVVKPLDLTVVDQHKEAVALEGGQRFLDLRGGVDRTPVPHRGSR